MLKSERYKGMLVATSYGLIHFDDKGESKDLKEAQEKALGKLPGFEYVADKPKKEEPKKEPAKKEPAKKAEPKKASPKKPAAKKATTSKKEEKE